MEKKQESDSKLIKRLIKERHKDAWLIEYASIGEKLKANEYGAFTQDGLFIYILSKEKKLIKTGELIWPVEKHGEVDHFAIKSIFSINNLQFITGDNGKEVQSFLEGEKKNTFTKKARPIYRKILGFRSGQRWKQVTAIIGYLLMLFFIISLFNGNDSEKKADQSSEEKIATTTTKMASSEDQNKSSNINNLKNTSLSSSDTKDKKEDNAKKEDTTSTNKIETTEKNSNTNKNLVPVTLIKTVDGDTIKVNYKGKEETVRYLLVDTPEEKKPGTCVQPYAVSAYNENKQIVNSGKLSLEFETNGDKRDKYGRLLAYVFVDGKSVQEKLLKDGYARVAYIYNPPYKYLSKYQSDEKIAENKHLNIWSKSGFVTDKGFNGCASDSSSSSKSAQNHKSTTANNSGSTSSNTSNTDSNQSSSPTTSGQTDFANCTELRKVYPDGVPSTSPAYQSKMDRDHDNYACEKD